MAPAYTTQSSKKTSAPDVPESFPSDFVDEVMQKMVTWGKYNGKDYKWISVNDPEYFIWAANTHLANLGYTKTFGVMKQTILANTPDLDMKTTLSYGKYKDKSIVQVHKDDPSYIKWLLKKRQCDRHLSMDTRVMDFLLHGDHTQSSTVD